jgi:hypothetical protein
MKERKIRRGGGVKYINKKIDEILNFFFLSKVHFNFLVVGLGMQDLKK